MRNAKLIAVGALIGIVVALLVWVATWGADPGPPTPTTTPPIAPTTAPHVDDLHRCLHSCEDTIHCGSARADSCACSYLCREYPNDPSKWNTCHGCEREVAP